MSGEHQGKSVIVTGGAKGIGRGICEAFAADGAKVLCLDVDESAGEELAGQYDQLKFRQTDVTINADCEAAVKMAASEFGGVDVLCNNVGIQPMDSYLPADELSEEGWDRIIAVNLKSYFLMTKHCVPELRKRGGGAIINTASVQGLQSMKGVSAYAASKGGIITLTKQLSIEYAADNIRVLAVNPGTIETPMVQDSLKGMSAEEEAAARKAIAAGHPLNRMGQPSEIANLVLFLASDKASFMTGDNINCDGGLMSKGAWADADEEL